MNHEEHVFLASDGTEIYYYAFGEGQPLLFVHGSGSDKEAEVPAMELMCDNFFCIAFDQRGFGKTAGNGNIGIEQSARDAKELIEYLKVKNVVFNGYSQGAAVLFSYVSQFGCKHLERVVIADMTPKPLNDENWKLGFGQGWYTREQYEKDIWLMENDFQTFCDYFAFSIAIQHTPDERREYVVTDEILRQTEELIRSGTPCGLGAKRLKSLAERIDGKLLKKYWQSMMEADFRGVLIKIDVPALVLYADPGSVYQPATAEYIINAIPNAKGIGFVGTTHLLRSERMEEFRDAILDFCNQQ